MCICTYILLYIWTDGISPFCSIGHHPLQVHSPKVTNKKEKEEETVNISSLAKKTGKWTRKKTNARKRGKRRMRRKRRIGIEGLKKGGISVKM